MIREEVAREVTSLSEMDTIEVVSNKPVMYVCENPEESPNDAVSTIDRIIDSGILFAIAIFIFTAVLPLVFMIIVIKLILNYLRTRRQDRYRFIDQSLQKGIQLPDSFYIAETPSRKETPRSAITWMGWGIAIGVFFLIKHTPGMAALALIPFFIGVARGTAYLINKRDNESSNRSDSF